MTKFYDKNNVLEITMRDPHTNEDFSADFFEDACNRKNYDESLDAFKVEDVEYLVDYAKDYVAGTNRDFDYPENYDPEESPIAYIDYSVEPLESESVITVNEKNINKIEAKYIKDVNETLNKLISEATLLAHELEELQYKVQSIQELNSHR